MLRNVLVPLDGTAFGEHALCLAAALARRGGGKLHLAHVHIETPPAVVAGVAVLASLEADTRQEERAYLEGVRKRLLEQGPLDIDVGLLEGGVVPALASYAERTKADLLVMSTHGRGALAQFWLGSVGDELLRAISQPMILVRPTEEQPDIQAPYEGRPVLVPLDGTEFAEQALAAGREMGQLFHAPLVLARVVPPLMLPVGSPEGVLPGEVYPVTTAEELQAEADLRRQEAEEYLGQIAAGLRRDGLVVKTRVVVDDQPARGVLLVATEENAGLITMETHARTGLSWLWNGSVAEALVQTGHVPVWLSRPTLSDR